MYYYLYNRFYITIRFPINTFYSFIKNILFFVYSFKTVFIVLFYIEFYHGNITLDFIYTYVLSASHNSYYTILYILYS